MSAVSYPENPDPMNPMNEMNHGRNRESNGSSAWIAYVVIGVFCGVIVIGVICVAVVIVIIKMKEKKQDKTKNMVASQQHLKNLRERDKSRTLSTASKTETSTKSTKKTGSRKSERTLPKPPIAPPRVASLGDEEIKTAELSAEKIKENQDAVIVAVSPINKSKQQRVKISQKMTKEMKDDEENNNGNVMNKKDEVVTTVICNYGGDKRWKVRNKPPVDFSFSIESE